MDNQKLSLYDRGEGLYMTQEVGHVSQIEGLVGLTVKRLELTSTWYS